ncbi:MAG: protein kinase [Pyrinomonadaceae bacterium]|nr:protein kinase [Pyrinomonadaceae bacterium]
MINQTISHYRILSKLGAGGMGEVYLAQDSRLNRMVALKILVADVAQDQGRIRRFSQEARAASALTHSNVAHIYEIGEADGIPFIAMEYVEGQALDAKINGHPLEISQIIQISIEVADALEEAHSKGITHRDIKPSNIMLTPRGQAKVLDFGLAKMTKEVAQVDSDISTQMKTSPGVTMGTLPYMSPEQALGREVDHRSDIFSLGAVMYEMGTGRLPFSGASAVEVIGRITHAQPEAIARFNYDIPAELVRIIRKCLEKDKERRYQSARELWIDLKNLERESSHTATVTAGKVVPQPRSSIRRSVIAALALAIVAIIAAGVYLLTAQRETVDSIAVLPFVNVGADPEMEYLSDGITESLINSLSGLPNLRVMSRTSVFRYKGRDLNAEAVGRELKVGAVLTGRIVQRSDDLAISVELVNARDNTHIWGEQYNRPLSDIIAVQGEIARDISEKLRLRLTGEEQRRLTQRYTENTEAYQLYLKGRYHLNRLTDDGFMKGREYFQQAIDKDPNYALAYAGLADAYNMLSGFNVLSPKECYPSARTAAMKALALDDKLAEAYTSLGTVKLTYDWDWSGAEREFKRAIEINPSHSDAHQMYSFYLSAMGRFDEALAGMKHAQELDPLSLAKIAGIGDIFYYQRQYDRAIEQYQKALEMDANSGFAHWSLGNAYVQKGMYADAIAEYQKSIPLSGDSPDEPASLGYAYALSGKRREAQQVIDELQERSKRRYISPTVIAFIYAGLGEKDQAFALLDKAHNERDVILVLLKVEPMFNSLRSDPRFADLTHRVGLPP